MKKYLFKISALVLLLTFFSCKESLLDIPQKSVLESDSYYENAGPNEAESLISSIYNQYYAQIEGVAVKSFPELLE